MYNDNVWEVFQNMNISNFSESDYDAIISHCNKEIMSIDESDEGDDRSYDDDDRYWEVSDGF
jgi:hypothetical protein